jgi:ADP-heptose:LPS heptosyltransferase
VIPLPERPVLVVFELGFVGDSLMTLPTQLALRAAHPRARLVRVVNAAMSELWKAPKLREARRVLALIRSLRPDAFLNLHTPDRERPPSHYWRDSLFSLGTGANLRLGWSHGLDSLLLTHAVPRSCFGRENMANEVFRVAAPLASAPLFDGFAYWHDDAHRREGERQLARAAALDGLDFPEGYLAVSPFAKESFKELRPEQLGDLLSLCWERSGLPAVLLGGPADAVKVEELRVHFRSPVLDLVGQNGFKVAAGLLERARAVLAVDSGLMHLSTLVRAPCVAVFGPMPLHRWRPFRDERLQAFVGRTRGIPDDQSRAPFDLERIADAVAAAAASRG